MTDCIRDPTTHAEQRNNIIAECWDLSLSKRSHMVRRPRFPYVVSVLVSPRPFKISVRPFDFPSATLLYRCYRVAIVRQGYLFLGLDTHSALPPPPISSTVSIRYEHAENVTFLCVRENTIDDPY